MTVQYNFVSEEQCIRHLEQLRWGDDIVSPFDTFSKIYICKNYKYRCRNTGKYFNVKTNTLFHNSKISLQKWFEAIKLYNQDAALSSVALSLELDITQKTAWHMLTKLKQNMGPPNSQKTSTDSQNKLQLVDWLSKMKN